MLTDNEKALYERNIIVGGFGEERQELLCRAKVVVVGAGGLGSAALYYLAAAGVGRLGIVEFDTVSRSNLQRQILYTQSDLDRPKSYAAKKRLEELNPNITIIIHPARLTDKNASEIFEEYDIVVDCTDNFLTRYIIDDHTSKLGLPMVYGTAEGTTGQVSVFNCRGAGRYRDLFPENDAMAKDSAIGTLSPLPGIIGSIEAMEAVKLITGFGEPLCGRLLTFDAMSMRSNIFTINR